MHLPMPDEPVPEAPADALRFLIADPCANKAFLTHLALSCMASDTAHVTIVTRDIDAYQRLIDELLDAEIGLARYFTYIVTKPVKNASVPPFDDLLQRDAGK